MFDGGYGFQLGVVVFALGMLTAVILWASKLLEKEESTHENERH